jgi:hypothetical protein
VGPAVVGYLEDGEPADLSETVPSDARLIDPAGLEVVPAPTVELVESDPKSLAFTFSGAPWLIPGIWSVSAILSVGGNSFRTVPARFVVDAPDGWLTVPDARSEWRDAPSSDAVLYRLLYSARLAVVTWGRAHDPELVAAPRPTDNLVDAQRTQARNTWNAVKSDPANQGIGDEGFVIRPFPLDWTVKNLIRPQSAKPVVR